MTAAELIALLQQVKPDTQIRVWADHGQMCLRASTAGLQTIRKEDLGRDIDDVISADDADGYTKDELAYVFEIGAP